MEEIAKLNVWDGADSPFPAGEFKVYISSLAPEPPQLSVLQGGVHLTFSNYLNMKLSKNCDCVIIAGVAQESVRELGAVLLRLGYGVIKLSNGGGFVVAGENGDDSFANRLLLLAKHYDARIEYSPTIDLAVLTAGKEFDTFANYGTLAKQSIASIADNILKRKEMKIIKRLKKD